MKAKYNKCSLQFRTLPGHQLFYSMHLLYQINKVINSWHTDIVIAQELGKIAGEAN